MMNIRVMEYNESEDIIQHNKAGMRFTKVMKRKMVTYTQHR